HPERLGRQDLYLRQLRGLSFPTDDYFRKSRAVAAPAQRNRSDSQCRGRLPSLQPEQHSGGSRWRYVPAADMFQRSFCDPRGIGFNPIVKQIWTTMMPLPNDPQYIVSGASDGVNQQGYLAKIQLPQSSDFFVARLDHDFGEKWKFMTSYRYYRFKQLAT